MNLAELLAVSDDRNVEIALRLPGFEGLALIMVGGAITTVERYGACEMSFCHLFEDGMIRRFEQVIGSFADIEVLNIVDAQCVTSET